VRACHDLSDGGLLVAVAEMAMASGVGAVLTAEGDHGFWFGEDQARYVLAVANGGALVEAARAARIPARVIGNSQGRDLVVAGAGAISIGDLAAAHESTLPRLMEGV
jgi:phosphoribosylformylglycinamidine synthase